ncbi:MAG TPA: S41 family peptidase [Saprospiraceae bacterium]|nr:S41 family peptidase [Saprospiraceae bacterium]
MIRSINSLLNERYIFPEVAREMTDMIHSNYTEGTYSKMTKGEEFAKVLTKDLLSVSKAKHLRVTFDPKKILEIKEAENSNDQKAIRYLQMENMRKSNFDFREVTILEGNTGHIHLTIFFHTELAGGTTISAMDKVKNTDELIIDLRKNGGGSPSMIQLLSSYFFQKPVHLNSFYFRPTNSYQETWTLDQVKGKKRPDVPIYILTSNYTFSAAEEFTYNLKNLKRATIIGEVTGGGAHPGGSMIVNDRFMVWIPTGRAINPITNTNWEGAGVIPDIEVSADMALEIALKMAIQKS